MKEIGTEDGFGLVGYYVDPLTETREYTVPILYVPTRVGVVAIVACWEGIARAHRN